MITKQDITAEEVLRLLQSPPEKARDFNLGVARNLRVLRKLEITDQTYQTEWLHFTNCEFTQEVVISNISFGSGISFQNCTFKKLVLLENVEFSSETPSDVIFSDCIVDRICGFRNCTIKNGGIQILKCEVKNRINFVSNHLKAGGIKMDKSSIFDIHDFALNRLSGTIEIHHSTISEHVRFDTNNYSSINITHSTFSKSFWIAQGRCYTGVSVSDSSFNDKFTLDSVRFAKNFGVTSVANKYMRGAIIKYRAHSEGNRRFFIGPRSLYLEANIFQSKFECLKVEDDKLDYKSQIDVYVLNLVFSDQQKGELEFSNINFHKVNVTGVNTSSSNSFYQTTIRTLAFNKVINKGTINFVELTPYLKEVEHFTTQIEILSSHLGDTRFMTTYFNEYDKLRLSDSDLSFITISPFNWFSGEKSRLALRHGDNAKPRYWFWKYSLSDAQLASEREYAHLAKELQRQLKTIADRMGERTYALIFKSVELQMLYRELQLNTKLINKEKILLAFNSVNDFGTNWLKPLLFLIVSTAILYIPIEVASSNEIHFKITLDPDSLISSAKILSRDSYVFWELLNPTHSISKLYGDNVANNWAYPLDYLQRILFGVFAFQTITAFRKYAK